MFIAGNAYIQATSSLLRQGETNAYLISPLLDSPYCMTFNYSINKYNTTLDVTILSKKPIGTYKIWSTIKTTVQENARITLPQAGLYQVIFQKH